jgi:hypothetical protein
MTSLRKPALIAAFSVSLCLVPAASLADDNPNNLPDCNFSAGIPPAAGLTDAQAIDMYYNPDNYTYLTICDPTVDFGVILPPNLQALIPVVNVGTQKYDPLAAPEDSPTPSPTPSPTQTPAVLSAATSSAPAAPMLPDTGSSESAALIALSAGTVAGFARLKLSQLRNK